MSQLRYYDIELNQPQGSWWQHLPKWDPKQGWFPSDQINDENAVYVARHSSGNPEDNLNNPEWRRLNLTIAGMAEMAQMAKHSGPTDPFSYLLGESEYMPRRGIDMKRSDTWMLPSAYAGQKSEKVRQNLAFLLTCEARRHHRAHHRCSAQRVLGDRRSHQGHRR